jgi:protein-tyrosine phosphatase
MAPPRDPSTSFEACAVLFVCMGNICRSPTAEGVFRHHVIQAGLESAMVIDSAGTHAYHVGEPPDKRSMAAALRRGYDLSAQRARHVCPVDFEQFDFILAMDRDNLALLQAECPPAYQAKLQLFLSYATDPQQPLGQGQGLRTREVPDPYFGGADGFERVLDLIEDASRGLLGHIQATYLLSAPR